MTEAERTAADATRTGSSVAAIEQALLDNLFYILGKFPDVATQNDYYQALAYTVRDRLLHRWILSARTYKNTAARTVCYLSAEFLPGPHLAANVLNLGLEREVRAALAGLGLDFDALVAEEHEPGLGNGGLGRLAACYMESMANLQIPAIGYGIRYAFGIFTQELRDGWQVEVSDKWLRYGNPWELHRPKITFDVKLGGHTEHYRDAHGRYRVRWTPARVVRGVAYDTPILGYRTSSASFLRLFSAEAPESFDFEAFNVGDYYGAVEDKLYSENLSKVLYPNDDPAAGKRLRLEQQYFMVSCALRDMLRIHAQTSAGPSTFHVKYAIQLNDTHPAVAIPELMRLFVDEYELEWDEAWSISCRTFSYTNHTLLPEALERWPVELFGAVLPRHLEIVYEINRRFLDEVRMRHPNDADLVRRLSLIDESGSRYVRMAHLACVGSHAVNGVAALHTELLKSTVLKDLHAFYPQKISNQTNGVTPRRFLMLDNPDLASLIDGAIGDAWRRDLERLTALEPLVEDAGFRAAWREVKRAAKTRTAHAIRQHLHFEVDPLTLFDVQAKRIHEYKRQHLNLLHLVTLYVRLKQGRAPGAPRTFLFGGKAAPGYFMAKLIIKLVNSVAEVVNRDPDVAGQLKVVFWPNFNVQNSRYIYPAADLSEQISTAGKEASGTGNMKFAMNGALTIGTLDGANVEIRERVGAENFFLFGMTADEVAARRAAGYNPFRCYEENAELRAALELVASGHFSHGDRTLFRPLVHDLLHRDDYFVLADYVAYVEAQEAVTRAWQDAERWTRMSILNVARIGFFSADRAIFGYCRDIWHITPLPIEG
ncbi:MAG: glycogen/starch/alpha-glucan phosphorylase [Gammaproteobacteria bacterium]|nr:glycogen/starch/alpha-glucan phosphorylase [Gammaproteobacteria bacterium]